MSKRSTTELAWLERQALSLELASSRQQIITGTQSLRSSVNIKARAKALVVRRPAAVVVGTLAAGALAIRLLPSLLWRKKGSLLSRFTGEVAKGAAGVALPIILRRMTRHRPSSAPQLPATSSFPPT